MTSCFARWIALILAVCVGLSPYVVSGAELKLTPIVVEILQPDLTPFPSGMTPSITSLHGVPLTAKVDFFMEIGDLQTELGFGNMVFSVDNFRTRQNQLVQGWQPDVTLLDLNGDLPGGLTPKWDSNMDIGHSALDLRHVLVGLFPRDFGDVGIDPRHRIGQDGPVYVGSIYVDWDGEQPGLLRSEFDTRNGAFSTFGADRLLVKNSGAIKAGDIQFGMPVDGQNMRALDWDQQQWKNPADMQRTFRVDNVRIDVSMTGDTAFDPRSAGGPMINSIVAGSQSPEDGLNFIMDFRDPDQAMTALLEFSREVTDVEFALRDIDLGEPTENHPGFVDQVTIRGFLGEAEVMPLVFGDGANLIEGNVITGTQALEPYDNSVRFDNTVRFDQPIDRIELRYGSGSGAPGDPGRQGIDIHDIYFTVNNPEPGTIALASMGCGVLLLRAVWSRRRARR